MLGNREARTMRVLLVLLVLLILPGEVEARRGQRVLVIRDYTSASWQGVVAQTVQDFNAVMPQGGPELRYERADEGACPQFRTREVAVCLVAADSIAPAVGRVYVADKGAAHIVVSDAYRPTSVLLCHELMHVLTGVGDNYGALPDQSCVHGSLPYPGPFDVDLLGQRYARKHR
jgi:hypothetical protein